MKKLLALILALVMLLSLAPVFAGCEDSKSPSSGGNEAENVEKEENNEENGDNKGNEEENSEPDKLNGKLTVAAIPHPPYIIWDNNEPSGVDVEIAKVLAEKLELEIEFVKYNSFDDALQNVKDGNADAIFSLVYNEEYLDILDYSIAYMEDRQVVVVPKYSDIKDLDSLKQGDYRIAVNENTPASIYAMTNFGQNLIRRDGYDSAMSAVASYTADCALVDYVAAIKYKDTYNLEILEEDFLRECYSVGVSKDNPELRQAMDLALTDMINDGTIDSILDKYIV